MSAWCPACPGVGQHFPGCPEANPVERCPDCGFVLPAHANGCAALGAAEAVTLPCPGPGCGEVVPVDGRCPYCNRLLMGGASATPDILLPNGVRVPLTRPVRLGRLGGDPRVETALAPYGTVSRHHAEVSWQEGRLHVRRLSPINPTFVNGVAVGDSAEFSCTPPIVLGLGPTLEITIVEGAEA